MSTTCFGIGRAGVGILCSWMNSLTLSLCRSISNIFRSSIFLPNLQQQLSRVNHLLRDASESLCKQVNDFIAEKEKEREAEKSEKKGYLGLVLQIEDCRMLRLKVEDGRMSD